MLHTGAGPSFVRTDVIPTSTTPVIKPTETCLRSAGDITLKVCNVIRLPVDFEGEVVNVVFRVSPITATKMILETAFINKFVKSIEPDQRRIVPINGRSVPILASFCERDYSTYWSF